MATSHKPKSAILDQLEPTNGGLGIEWIDYWGREVEERADERFESERQALFVVAKSCIRESAEDIKPRTSFPCYRRRMGGEGEGWIEGDAQEFWVVCLRNIIAIKIYRWEATELLVPRSEQSYC